MGIFSKAYLLENYGYMNESAKKKNTPTERFVSNQIRTLVPNYDTGKLKATVSSSSFSVDFFVTIDGKKMHCFDMIDEGMFTERKFNTVSKTIANYFRGLSDFDTNGINKYTVVLKNNI